MNHCEGTSRVTAETLPIVSAVVKNKDLRDRYFMDLRLAKDSCIPSVVHGGSRQEEGWTQRDHVEYIYVVSIGQTASDQRVHPMSLCYLRLSHSFTTLVMG